MENFITHGYYTVSNLGGYEIQLSDCGSSARVKDSWGNDNPIISEWFEIEYIENGYPNMMDEDKEMGELIPVIDPNGYDIPLNMVMKVNV